MRFFNFTDHIFSSVPSKRLYNVFPLFVLYYYVSFLSLVILFSSFPYLPASQFPYYQNIPSMLFSLYLPYIINYLPFFIIFADFFPYVLFHLFLHFLLLALHFNLLAKLLRFSLR